MLSACFYQARVLVILLALLAMDRPVASSSSCSWASSKRIWALVNLTFLRQYPCNLGSVNLWESTTALVNFVFEVGPCCPPQLTIFQYGVGGLKACTRCTSPHHIMPWKAWIIPPIVGEAVKCDSVSPCEQGMINLSISCLKLPRVIFLSNSAANP